MRIISGASKGRKLTAPRGLSIRPTTDFVKEALFQLIENLRHWEWKDCVVLDLFAGTGALGIEALSRGAKHCVFVDKSLEARSLIQRNLQICGDGDGLKHRATIYITELFKITKTVNRNLRQHMPFQLILADPPYETGLSTATIHFIAKNDLLSENGILVVEERKNKAHAKDKRPIELNCSDQKTFICVDERCYGDTVLWFYEKRLSGQEMISEV